MLLFKKKFLDAIRTGNKTQTIRLWKRCPFRAGGRSYIPGVGYIWITAVDPVCMKELTDDDAILDGFASAVALVDEIRTLYSDRNAEGSQAYRLRFRLMSPKESAAAREARVLRKAAAQLKRSR